METRGQSVAVSDPARVDKAHGKGTQAEISCMGVVCINSTTSKGMYYHIKGIIYHIKGLDYYIKVLPINKKDTIEIISEKWDKLWCLKCRHHF